MHGGPSAEPSAEGTCAQATLGRPPSRIADASIVAWPRFFEDFTNFAVACVRSVVVPSRRRLGPGVLFCPRESRRGDAAAPGVLF